MEGMPLQARFPRNRQLLSKHRRRYEITSYHGTTLPIEIVESVPVPQESAINVEVLEGATAPTVRNLDGKEGVYLWKPPGTAPIGLSIPPTLATISPPCQPSGAPLIRHSIVICIVRLHAVIHEGLAVLM